MIEDIPFSSNICGILDKELHVTSIALNSNRTPDMQNFDCMHEIIHYFFHEVPQQPRICYDGSYGRIEQDSRIEWQANEGAAQFLVPYQDFIPRFLRLLDEPAGTCCIQGLLADHYGVTPQVINIRIANLGYEIDQYRAGIPMNKITLLSKRKQIEAGIQPTSYRAMCGFALQWDAVI